MIKKYINMSKACKSVFNTLNSNCTYNYISDNNNKII